jgi:translation initiation factor IF-2
VDGSVEALADSLQQLSTSEIQVNILHKGVGQISESDVLLATASDAIVIGFNVRPSLNARKIAETENIEIKLYSIIYNAIEEIKAAMEGLLEPTIEEKIIGNLEVREVFNITKVGTIAGCFVKEGKIIRQSKVRIIRDGIVVHTGSLSALKRFKDDVKDVSTGMDCGVQIKDYQNIVVGDNIEVFEEIEIQRKL